jgi:hypothetical protein
MDRSASSTGDPFRFQQPQCVSAVNESENLRKKSEMSAQYENSSTKDERWGVPKRRIVSPNFNAYNDDAENSLSFVTSNYPRKPYISKRLEVYTTTSLITEEPDGPLGFKRRRLPMLLLLLLRARVVPFAVLNGKQQQQEQQHQRSPSMRDMHPRSISFICLLINLACYIHYVWC